MSIRYKTNSQTNFGISPLPGGYEHDLDSPDLQIPSCGIEDVDTSIFNLFDKEINAACGGQNGAEIKKVPVIFAAGEKWALLKRGRPLRDRNNTLLLPLITIMRSELNQTLSSDVAGRGINQQTGEIVIRRRLDKSDRQYQSLINRLFLTNQKNLAVPVDDETVLGQISTERNVGQLSETQEVHDGSLLRQNRTNNVYETIVVPSPQFYTAKYQVTIWTQYTQHSNQILEKIFSTFLPQGQCWRIESPKGYWFVARVEDASFSSETNFDDMSQQERFIKHTFSVEVPAYFFVPSVPGSPIPIKRYVSSPTIAFDIIPDVSDDQENPEDVSQYVLGSDDPTLPLDEQRNKRDDQRNIGWRSQKIYPVLTGDELAEDVDPIKASNDPALKNSCKRQAKIKVLNKNSRGETAYSGADLGGLIIKVTK